MWYHLDEEQSISELEFFLRSQSKNETEPMLLNLTQSKWKQCSSLENKITEEESWFKAHIWIEDHRISFNQETIRWLEVWLNTELIFKIHFQKHLQKVKKTETRIRALSWKKDLISDLVLRIQIVTVQATALYKAELWWHR